MTIYGNNESCQSILIIIADDNNGKDSSNETSNRIEKQTGRQIDGQTYWLTGKQTERRTHEQLE